MGIQGDTRALRAVGARLAELMAWDDARLYARVESVSAWSVAQQLEHVLHAGLSMLLVIERLAAGVEHDVIRDRGSPSMPGRAVLLTGRIPRGRADAPDFTLPQGVPARAALAESVEGFTVRLAARAATADALRSVPRVGRHPVLGWFSAAQWWRFLRVHSEHHLAIVDDIDRQRLARPPVTAPPRPLPDPSTG